MRLPPTVVSQVAASVREGPTGTPTAHNTIVKCTFVKKKTKSGVGGTAPGFAPGVTLNS